MENRIGNKAKRLGARRRLKSLMARIAIVMSGIAVFCVVYILLAPGLTAEWPLQCELEEHIHNESCYTLVAASETEIVPAESELICGLEEAEGHIHSDECYTKLCGALICEDADHEHSDDCYEWTQELTCGAEESEGHSHSDECYSVTEATDDENEPEEIYELTCGLEEHTHLDGCYIIPDNKETYYCGFLTEHTHKDDCYFESGELKCNIPEHLHDDSCLVRTESVTLDESFSAESEDGDVIVTVHITGEVTLPVLDETDEAPGFELVLTESEDMDLYDEYAELAAQDGEVMAVVVFNYTLTYGRQEVDLSGCEVTAEITPTEAFEEMMNSPMEIMTLAMTEDGEDGEDGEDEADTAVMFNTYSSENVVAYAITQGQGANPSFTVQYYANLNRAVKSGSGTLAVIDTDGGSTAADSNKGGKLPVNGGKSTTTTPNGKDLAYLELNNGKIKTETKLTEIYQAETFEYQNAPGLKYFNIVLTNKDSHYTLKEIWVLNEGGNKNSIDSAGWTVYPYTSDIRFTNRPETAQDKENYILIDDDALIRLVYDTQTTDQEFPANFYDYDISTGLVYRAKPNDPLTYINYKTAGQTFSGNELTADVLEWAAGLSGWDKHLHAYTRESGINSSDNYSGSGTKLAFGNVNTGTNLGGLTWSNNGNDNELNKYNNKSYQGCTFGIADSLDANGNIKYASGINAPKLFNDGGATGKTVYDNYSLNFNRVGDTYTLSAVNGTGATNLSSFNNPTNSTGKHTDIWTNNFWPMDSAPSFGTGTHDVKFGGTATFKGGAHEIRFGPITQKKDDYTFPESDDGKYHNSYFGMQYAVTFDLTSSYIGPLEYYFFGDDDMWVFLDGKLVCDIGGIHSSVGEYVNLWDWIDRSELLDEDGKPVKVNVLDENGQKVQAKDKNGKPVFEEDGTTPVWEMTDKVKTYTLSFYYTERGASGSTCWMQFTLPTVVGLNLDAALDEQVDKETGSLSVEKVLDGVENTDWFMFKITGLDDNYEPDYLLRDANGNLIDNEKVQEDSNYKLNVNSEFCIRAGDVLVLRNLPDGAKVTVTELNRTGYHTTVEVNGEKVEDSEGTTGELIIKKGERTKVVYTNISSYELPATGGSGTFLLYASGAALVLLALVLMFNKKTRRKGAAC